MALNEFMLKDADVLESIDLSVDYFGNDASVDEHGEILLEVNRAELCVQSSLPATEWWPTVHCMFGMQSCLTNGGAAGTSCQEAETGVDDDLAFAGGDRMAQLSGCECSLDGVADTCASLHASKSWADLKAACDVDASATATSAPAAIAPEPTQSQDSVAIERGEWLGVPTEFFGQKTFGLRFLAQVSRQESDQVFFWLVTDGRECDAPLSAVREWVISTEEMATSFKGMLQPPKAPAPTSAPAPAPARVAQPATSLPPPPSREGASSLAALRE